MARSRTNGRAYGLGSLSSLQGSGQFLVFLSAFGDPDPRLYCIALEAFGPQRSAKSFSGSLL